MMMMVLVVMIITGDDVAVDAGDSGEHVVDNGVADARGDYNGDNDDVVVVVDDNIDDNHDDDDDNAGVADHDDADGDDDDDEDDGVRYLSLLGFAVVACSLSTPPPSSPSCC